MIAPQLSAALGIWRARQERTGAGKVYSLYVFLLLAVIVIVPIVRALWVVLNTQAGLAVLSSANATDAVSMIVAALWVGALLAGRKRGPALLPPFLLHALAGSGIRRALAFREPMLRSVMIFAAACAAAAGLAGIALRSDGHAQPEHVIVFAATAVSAGIITVVLWLVGQVYPRAALAVSLIVLVLSGVSLASAEVLAFTPWGWVGATYPLTGSNPLSPFGTGVLAAASIAMAPVLLDRLTEMRLSAQAAQWERATAFSFSFDIGPAAALYEAKPRLGRDIRFITPSRPLWATFLLRDLVGQARTPGRLLGGITATAASGILMTLSLLPGTPSALLAGAAGIVIYGATSPLTKGLQHAASVAGDYPLYGISDRSLVLLHTLFPLVALLATLITFATVTASMNGVPLGVALPGVSMVGVLALALRFSNALKGPLPPSLLTPFNTPVGDLSIVTQIGWAISEPLIEILGALTVTLLPFTPIPLAVLALGIGAFLVIRWKKRR